jgi:hypothetical protein
MHTKFWLERLKGRDHSEDVDGRIISKWILRKQGGTGFISIRYGPVTGSCEHGNEPSGSIKEGKFDKLSVLFVSRGLCYTE